MDSSSTAQGLARTSNAIWSLVANVTYAVGQWGVLVVLARLSTPEVVGEYSLALALSGPIFMATNMRLRFLQATDVARRFSFAGYARVRLFSIAVAIAGVVSAALAWVKPPALIPLIALVAIFKGAEAAQDVVLGRFQQLERMDLAAVSTLVSGVLTVLGLAVVFAATGSLLIAVAGLIGLRIIQLVLFDFPRARYTTASTTTVPCDASEGDRGAKRRPKSEVLGIAALAWPLGIAACIDSLNVNVPRYYIAAFDSHAELGIFSAMAYISFAGFVLVNAIGQSWVTALARSLRDGDLRKFWQQGIQLLGVAALVGATGIVVAILAGPEVLRLIYGAAYAESSDVFVSIMIAGAFSYLALAFVFVLTALGHHQVQILLYLCNLAVTTLACSLWVPRLGIAGAALALVVAGTLQVVVSIFVVLRGSGTRWKASTVR